MTTAENLEEELNKILEGEVPFKSQVRFLEMCGYENLKHDKGYLRITAEMNEIIDLYNRSAHHAESAMKFRTENYRKGVRELQYLSTIMVEIAKVAPDPKEAWKISFQSLMLADKWAIENNDTKLRNEIYKQYWKSVEEAKKR